jgi:outer membrane phospholipase A
MEQVLAKVRDSQSQAASSQEMSSSLEKLKAAAQEREREEEKIGEIAWAAFRRTFQKNEQQEDFITEKINQRDKVQHQISIPKKILRNLIVKEWYQNMNTKVPVEGEDSKTIESGNDSAQDSRVTENGA